MYSIAEEDSEQQPQEAPEVISFKEEAIGYIEDEMAQGYGLDQIRKELLEEGYPKEVIEFAADYVEKHHKVSERQKTKEVPKTDAHHHARRFHLPVMLIIVLIAGLMGIFIMFGIGSPEERAPEKIDIFLYDKLGLQAGVHTITDSVQLYVDDYLVEEQKAKNLLKQNSKEALLSGLRYSNSVSGFQKRATRFTVEGGGASVRTLMELRFQVSSPVSSLKVIDSIPSTQLSTSDVVLTSGGVVAKDGVLLFTFNDLKPETAYEAAYVVEKTVDKIDSMTFAAEPSQESAAARTIQTKANKVCGDGKCVIGESFRTCCNDCGCPSGFICSNNVCGAAQEDECATEGDCDDGDMSTSDKCSGTPKTCSNLPITDCVGGDSYCPAGCFFDDDDDCAPAPVEEVEEEVDLSSLDITGPQESPDIIDMAITPEDVLIGEELYIEALVEDANGKDDIERVWFEVLELAQTHGESGDMRDDGIEPDIDPDDDIYTGSRVIGEHYLTGSYHLTVFAQDRAGNKKKMQGMFRVVTMDQLIDEGMAEEVTE